MACERNRILELSEYLTSLGIEVNIGKNKARGHNGIFMQRSDLSRIDISGNVKDENKILSVLLHEFAHFIHYSYDKKLKDLDFVFGEMTDELKEELINITVQDIPKDFATSLFKKKDSLSEEIRLLTKQMREINPEFKLSEKFKPIERKLKSPIKYLLSYDRVKYLGELFAVNNISEYNLSEEERLYIKIKYKQRVLKRISSRINRINKYYNNPSELFARFLDSYYLNHDDIHKIAPVASRLYENSKITFIKKLNQIFSIEKSLQN